MTTQSRTIVRLLIVGLLLLGSLAGAQEAEEQVYEIGPGDVLRLNVPQLPELDGEITVQSDGSIYVQQVGEVNVAGLSLSEAEELIGRRLRLFDPAVGDVVLSVMEYNALRVFTLGAVANPGALNFETPPTVWEVLRAAGGPTGEANLASCRIIAEEDGRPRSRIVDLSGYLSGEGLPDDVLRSGDTLIVPLIAEGSVGVPASRGVQVFGGVGVPTTVPIQGPTDLVSVLMLAGAPLENARLAKVDWVHRDRQAATSVASRVDMRQFLEDGKASGNPLIYPGDVVYMHYQRPGWLERNLPLFLALVTTTTTALLAYDRLSE
jgi:polysaccharide export outer membrane protein